MSDEDIPLPPETGNGFFGDAPTQEAASTIEANSPAESHAGTPYRVLARKYRPQNFDDLIGQESLVRILRRAFAVGRVAHAFMLTGVRGVGKTTTARIIARALNCTGVDGKGGPTADPCGVCPNCTAILADRHPDVLEMDAASRTGVDDVREIIEAARFRPMQGRMKVFVIDEVHMLSRNAFNALLKTLEEPPAQVTFIFATTELRKVPVTVLSRCQRFDLQRVPQTMLAAHFARIAQKEGATLEDGALALIARAADGSVRDGLSLLDQAIAQGAADTASVADMLGLADRGMVFDLLEAALRGEVARVLEIAEHAYARGADLGVLLADMMDVLHLLSRIQALPKLREGQELPEMERVRGAAMVDHVGVAALGRAWQLLLKGLAEVDIAPDRRQAAEMILIRLCHASLLPTPDRLIRHLQNAPPVGREGQGPATETPAPAGRPTPSSLGNGNGNGGDGGGGTTATKHIAPSGSPSNSVSSAQPAPAPSPSLSPPPSREVSAVIASGRPALRLVAQDGSLISEHEDASATPEMEEDSAPHVPPMPRTWREMVMLVKEQREARLHGVLRAGGHPVMFAPPRLILRIDDDCETARWAFKTLSVMLARLYPGQWQVEASEEAGQPSLDEQGAEVIALYQDKAKRNPLVQAILQRFPSAEIGEVRDPSLDDYGLPPEKEVFLGEDNGPNIEFAPIDADYLEEDDLD